jgi:hypothetical protein
MDQQHLGIIEAIAEIRALEGQRIQDYFLVYNKNG